MIDDSVARVVVTDACTSQAAQARIRESIGATGAAERAIRTVRRLESTEPEEATP